MVFHWTTYEDGFYIAFTGCSSFIVYVVIFPGLQKLRAYVSREQNPKNIDNVDAAPTPLAPVDQITGLELGNAESQHLSEQAALDESTTAESAKGNAVERLASVRNDLFFVIFGSAAYCVCYLIIPLFETEVVFVVGKFAMATFINRERTTLPQNERHRFLIAPPIDIASFLRAVGSVFQPSFSSLVTTIVPSHQIGKAVGGVCIMDTIVMSVSSLLYGWVFSRTSEVMPSAMYLMSFAITLSSGLITLSVWYDYRRSSQMKTMR